MKKRSIPSRLRCVAEYPIFAPQKAPKIGYTQGPKIVAFSPSCEASKPSRAAAGALGF